MSAYSVAVLADSPAAYFRLDETSGTFADSSGNAHTATISGGSSAIVTATSRLAADADAAAAFDWNGTLKQADTAFTFGASPMTIELWLSLADLNLDPSASGYFASTAGVNMILGATGAGADGWGLGFRRSDSKIYWAHQGVGEAFLSYAVSTGTTYHMVIVMTSTTSIDLYINGAFVLTQAIGGAMVNSTGALVLNNCQAGTNTNPRCTTNALDEVAVYTAALSAARIAAHYAAATTIAAGVSPARQPVPFTRGAGGGGKL